MHEVGEHGSRLEQLQQRMKNTGVDLTAIAPTSNMRYLLGFAPMADERLCLLLVTPGGKRLIVPELNADQVESHTGLEAIRWADDTGPNLALTQALNELHANRPANLAVDGAMRADGLLLLQGVARPQSCASAVEVMTELRVTKAQDEIDALIRAADQADRAMMVGIDTCEPGVTEREVAQRIKHYFRDDGAEKPHAIVASGPHSAFPHHEAGSRQLQQGDTIVIDIVARLAGYCSDITRMVHLGEPPALLREVYDVVLEANRRAREAAFAGARACDVDCAARSVIERAGYGPQFTHRTGHGLGMDLHEPPWISATNTQVLRPGMVFSVEPGVYLPGRFGVRIEDIVVVTDGACRCLTGLDRELIVKA